MDTVITQPLATPVIQALRSIGYNAQTAIADLVDNCMDAMAKNINIQFEYLEGNGFIRIEDDGNGMDDVELQKAMTIGSKDPREERSKSELGRFGMGLKTASFSLGKRLCVVSKKNGKIVERCWDLEFVSDENEWLLFNKVPEELREQIGEIPNESGTIVFIDLLDRFSGAGTIKPLKRKSYYSKIERIQRYLEMVFHVKLEDGILININDSYLKPWNPFLYGNQRVIEGEEQYIRFGRKIVKVTPFVLPHPSTFNQEDYKYAAGIKGWRDQQGFYIYRENRLVTFGEWFGMFPKDVQAELVRIKVEFSNESDDEWKLDVKKSTIAIPDDIKDDLRNIAKNYRKISQEIMLYRTKGSKSGSKIKGTLNTWELENDDVESQYVLNRTHPMLTEILKEISPEIKKLLNSYLRLVELGSPNNVLISSDTLKTEVIEVDVNTKLLIIECAKSLILASDEIMETKKLAEVIWLFPGFEGINLTAIEKIIEEEVIK